MHKSIIVQKGMVLLCSAAAIVGLNSCGNKSEENGDANKSNASMVPFPNQDIPNDSNRLNTDVPIILNVLQQFDEETLPWDYGKYKLKKETDQYIEIGEDHSYLSKYMSGKKFEASMEASFDPSINVLTNLQLSLDIVNNTDRVMI